MRRYRRSNGMPSMEPRSSCRSAAGRRRPRKSRRVARGQTWRRHSCLPRRHSCRRWFSYQSLPGARANKHSCLPRRRDTARLRPWKVSTRAGDGPCRERLWRQEAPIARCRVSNNLRTASWQVSRRQARVPAPQQRLTTFSTTSGVRRLISALLQPQKKVSSATKTRRRNFRD